MEQQRYFSPSRSHYQSQLTAADSLGHAAVRPAGHLCYFALLVLGVVTFTFVAAAYRPDDPILHASSHLTSFLTSTSSGSTFRSHDDYDSALPTGNDLLSASKSSSVSDVDSAEGSDDVAVNELLLLNESAPHHNAGDCDPNSPIDCSEQEVFHLIMRTAIETFRDVHFYRFGKPARGGDDGGTCDMAWRFRPKDARRAGFYKDYRRFRIARSPSTCAYTVISIGEYHTGVNARKKKPLAAKKKKPTDVPVVGDSVNDGLPKVESEAKFRSDKYLVYSGGGDRCKNMNHYLWSFLCTLGEAQYLNRTLVMDLSVCLSSRHASTNQDEEGKDFRFYFDFEHLRDSARIIDQRQFWTQWTLWQKKGELSMRLIENFRTTPMKLAKVQDMLIMRKFGSVEPDNYWYRVCEGETESVIRRPWHMIWKSRRLIDIVSGIASRMSWDFDSVHIVAGDKARDAKQWPKMTADTSPRVLLSTLGDRIEKGRRLYVATGDPDTVLLDKLKGRYRTHFLDEFRDLWGEESEWYAETKKLNSGLPVEFDGYMRLVVDTEVFLRGKKQLRVINDLTRDCKDGTNSCRSSS